MKITGLETFVVDAGWRPWQFIAVRIDEGITGYGECSDGRNPYGGVETAKEFDAQRGETSQFWQGYRVRDRSVSPAVPELSGLALVQFGVEPRR